MKRFLSVALVLIMALTLFSAVSVSAETESVVIFFDDASDADVVPSGVYATAITSEVLDGNSVYRFVPTAAAYITNANKAANAKSSSHRIRHSRQVNNFSIGIYYTISFKYKYVDKNGELDVSGGDNEPVPFNMISIADTFGNDPISPRGVWTKDTTSNNKSYYHNPSYTTGEDGWNVSSERFKVLNTKFKDSNGTSIPSTTITGLQLGVQSTLNGVLKDDITEAIANNPDSYSDARAALNAVINERGFAVLMDSISFTAELDATQIAMVNVSAPNAKVKINGIETENGEKVGIGYNSTIEVTPDEGYDLKSVKIDGVEQDIVGNKVAIENVFNADANVEVVAEIPSVAPAIDDSKTVARLIDDDTYGPTVYVYSVISNFSTGESLNYGIKLWDTAAPSNVFNLTARANNAGDLATATPGQAFVIKAYGDIDINGSYTAQPYIGTVNGTATQTSAE